MADTSPAIVLFRQDLRIADNEALSKAAASGSELVCLYVWDQRQPYSCGSAQRWWLHHSLVSFSRSLRRLGIPLNIRTGITEDEVQSAIAETGAGNVYWSRRYAPRQIECDRRMKANLRGQGIRAVSCKGRLLTEPWDVLNREGLPYRVFTAFWRSLRQFSSVGGPLPAPALRSGIELSETQSVDDLGLIPADPDWSRKFHAEWQPGEDGAQARLRDFMARAASRYAVGRDFPSQAATTRLSPHIQMGEISPRQILRCASRHRDAGSVSDDDFQKLHSELAWRDFNSHLLFHFPELPQQEFNPAFRTFPWRQDPASFTRWTKGQTGYPIVDAGMRELWQSGHMHNRVRMITASFLTKHLLIDWRTGMDWFWNTLLDADIASNSLNWQWVAGCGADAAPYFRIFNPVLQARKFDPDGDYIRRWVPELSGLAGSHLAEPWSAPQNVLGQAGIKLGETYPHPIVSHKSARERALAAYRSLRLQE